ncbi:hypothetical protein DXU77_03005 [Pseudomonas lactis]|nr:hypothetical protein [Pseudomonas lactis]
MRQGAGPEPADDQVTADVEPVGAGLPAMQTTRSDSKTEAMLSQASQLPQKSKMHTKQSIRG